MGIFRYTCLGCGLVTRALPGQNHRVCTCDAGYDIVDEDEEAQQ